MKKIKFLVLVFLLHLCGILSAQSYQNDASRKYRSSSQSKKKVKEREYKSNIMKLNLTGLLVKSFGIQYERKIRKKSSLAMGIIYRPKGSWFLSKFYDSTTANAGISQETRFMYTSSKYRSFILTPEYRFYLGRQAPRGLYLAAFARAKFDKTDFNYHYYEDNSVTQKVGLAKLNETMIGVGAMLGLHIITKKQLSIDFWFVGPWVANKSVKLSSKVNAANISELQQKFISQDMKDWVSRFSFKEDDLTKEAEVKWNNQGIYTVNNYFNFNVRFVGINIGYSF